MAILKCFSGIWNAKLSIFEHFGKDCTNRHRQKSKCYRMPLN
jgi:hypothetical protein